MERFNVIIVGAGSAGIPLAARLSENPDRKVLLLDAGPHYRSLDEYPLELRHGGLQGAMDPGHPNNWAFEGELTTLGAKQIVPRGKAVGGGSAVNGTIFERGLPEGSVRTRGSDGTRTLILSSRRTPSGSERVDFLPSGMLRQGSRPEFSQIPDENMAPRK